MQDPLVKAEQKGSARMGLCNAGSRGGTLKTLLPEEGCAIWSYYTKDYMKHQSQILSQNLRSHRICGLWPPIRDLTRKMLRRLSSYNMFALSAIPGDFGKVTQSLCTASRIKRGYLCSGRWFDYSKHSSSTKQYMHRGNPGLCPQLWPCWHHGHFPWSVSLAMNPVKTQVLSDPMQPLTLPSSWQGHASALSTCIVHHSCVIAFPSLGAPSAKGGHLWGFCLDFHLF